MCVSVCLSVCLSVCVCVCSDLLLRHARRPLPRSPRVAPRDPLPLHPPCSSSCSLALPLHTSPSLSLFLPPSPCLPLPASLSLPPSLPPSFKLPASLPPSLPPPYLSHTRLSVHTLQPGRGVRRQPAHRRRQLRVVVPVRYTTHARTCTHAHARTRTRTHTHTTRARTHANTRACAHARTQLEYTAVALLLLSAECSMHRLHSAACTGSIVQHAQGRSLFIEGCGGSLDP
jgi:hypothetical protein